ncbi:hypothetical protein Ahy_B06g083011 [Arachis hypogaea]|uniref:coproporphyrinogen oxidase n=1 Tax=Arachis hypogaea TaxID=3818 RepID=A0A444YP56_ARAHY|nr:hypothetical protein Ahy_B06g083011 [Arachis hypogaea]
MEELGAAWDRELDSGYSRLEEVVKNRDCWKQSSVIPGMILQFYLSFLLRFYTLIAPLSHRGERRGLGGIFFDDLNDYDQEMLLSFATKCANSVIHAYIPIIERRKDLPFTEQQKAWKQLRRGRHVEFNFI